MEEDWKKHGKGVEKEGRYFSVICTDYHKLTKKIMPEIRVFYQNKIFVLVLFRQNAAQSLL